MAGSENGNGNGNGNELEKYRNIVMNFDEVKTQTGSEIREISYYQPPVGKLDDGQYVAIFNVLAEHGFTPEKNIVYDMPLWMNNQLLINIGADGEKNYYLRYVNDALLAIEMVSGDSPISFEEWSDRRDKMHNRFHMEAAKKKLFADHGHTVGEMNFPPEIMDHSLLAFAVKASYPLDSAMSFYIRTKYGLPDWANNMLITHNCMDLGSCVVYPVMLRYTA